MDALLKPGGQKALSLLEFHGMGGLFQGKTYARKDLERWAVKQGKISITPMKLDLTDKDYLAEKSI